MNLLEGNRWKFYVEQILFGARHSRWFFSPSSLFTYILSLLSSNIWLGSHNINCEWKSALWCHKANCEWGLAFLKQSRMNEYFCLLFQQRLKKHNLFKRYSLLLSTLKQWTICLFQKVIDLYKSEQMSKRCFLSVDLFTAIMVLLLFRLNFLVDSCIVPVKTHFRSSF